LHDFSQSPCRAMGSDAASAADVRSLSCAELSRYGLHDAARPRHEFEPGSLPRNCARCEIQFKPGSSRGRAC
jgi:hypothetical protein